MKITSRAGLPAFTLIEMMAVIAIIVILASLVVGGLGYVTDKQNRSKASVQIGLLSKGLEDYKLDMGAYPAVADSTTGSGFSDDLFRALYFDSDADSVYPPTDTDQRIYLADLDPTAGKQGWTTGTAATTTMITDPWGQEYRYRSAFAAPVGTNPPVANTNTQNPDFDLWTVGKDGKTKAAPADSPTDKDNRDDIRNF